MNTLTRREFLQIASIATASIALADGVSSPRLKTRGVVLIPDDFSLSDWPERAQRAGLTTIGLHHGRSIAEVEKFVRSEIGGQTLARARQLGLEIEYELHAMGDLLPRAMFEQDKTLFRMNEQGERVSDFNLCVHSPHALEIVSANALSIAQRLRPTTGRYFYWGDDARPWCRCPKCGPLSDSDQALLLENALVKALRSRDPRAQLSHLAYATTIKPPEQIKPELGIFLEYAPIGRRYDIPYAQQIDSKDGLAYLDSNLKVFPANTAQALEYWLDVSRFSGWKRPAKKLSWNRDVFLADLETYAARGIRHITTFAVFVDADYLKLHGEPKALQEYGDGLRGRQVN